MPKSTLVIAGSHPATRHLAPFDNPAYDILVFNEAANDPWVKRWDIVLQLHTPTIYRNPLNRTDPKHWEWLQRDHGKDKRIYMQKRDPLVPNSVRYPIEQVKDMLNGLTIATEKGLISTTPVTNSISFAIALGIHLGYKRIILFGSEMASNTEYAYQRENFQFWMGYALGRGVRMEMHSGQSMVVAPLYGYDGDLTFKTDGFENGLKYARDAIAKACALRKDTNISLGMGNPNNMEEMKQLLQATFEANVQFGEACGMASVARRYTSKVKAMEAVTGSAIISRQEFEHQAALAEQAMKRVSQDIGRLDGQLEYLHRAYLKTGDVRALTQFMTGARRMHYLGRVLGVMRGRAQSNLQLMSTYDQRLQAAGGAKSLEAYKAQAAPEMAVA